MNSGEILRNWGAGITDEARQISLQWALVKYNNGIKPLWSCISKMFSVLDQLQDSW